MPGAGALPVEAWYLTACVLHRSLVAARFFHPPCKSVSWGVWTRLLSAPRLVRMAVHGAGPARSLSNWSSRLVQCQNSHLRSS
ncbi:hypothetical protein F5I97DRAFT_1380130 [Phlebopus sp. FC_14]|nr:hypothetical protein F5I97DRAFT_1380130 [Phlebopus sp. FC_14]